jgi:hypothetical protein
MWNKRVAEEETIMMAEAAHRYSSNSSKGSSQQGNHSIVKYYRKTEQQIECYYKNTRERENRKAAHAPHQPAIEELQFQLRSLAGSVQTGIGKPAEPVLVDDHNSDNFLHNSANAANNRFSTMAAIAPPILLSASLQRVTGNGPSIITDNSTSHQHSSSASTSNEARSSANNNESSSSITREVNQLLSEGKASSVGNTTTEDGRTTSLQGPIAYINSIKSTGRNNYSHQTNELIESVKEGKRHRQLHVCSICGHFRDYGPYADSHRVAAGDRKACGVPQEERATNEAYQGYCACDKCAEFFTAELKALLFPPGVKPRKKRLRTDI